MSANLLTRSFSLLILLLLNDGLFLVHTIEPRPLWVAINATLSSLLPLPDCQKWEKRECAQVILYNEDSSDYMKGNYSGGGYLKINIDSRSGDSTHGFMSQYNIDQVRTKIDASTKYHRCIIVISLVNTTKEVEQLRQIKNASSPVIQDLKLGYSLDFTRMMQFKTPVNQRYLLLVRFGESQRDFGQCHKKLVPYQQYPRRLVPIWEQVLFDFFPFVKALHAVRSEATVLTRKEDGNLIWMCEDIMDKMDEEDECKEHPTKDCETKMASGEYSAVGFDLKECSIFKARM